MFGLKLSWGNKKNKSSNWIPSFNSKVCSHSTGCLMVFDGHRLFTGRHHLFCWNRQQKWYFHCLVVRVWIPSVEAIQVHELFYMKELFSFSESSNWDLEISIHYLLWAIIKRRNWVFFFLLFFFFHVTDTIRNFNEKYRTVLSQGLNWRVIF